MRTNMGVSFGAALNVMLPYDASVFKLGKLRFEQFGERKIEFMNDRYIIADQTPSGNHYRATLLSCDEYENVHKKITEYNAKLTDEEKRNNSTFHLNHINNMIAEEIDKYMKDNDIGQVINGKRCVDLTGYKGDAILLAQRLMFAQEPEEVKDIIAEEKRKKLLGIA